MPSCSAGADETHERGFDANSDLAIMMYMYIPAALYGVWQCFARRRMESAYKPQLSSISQPVNRTLLWFARFLTTSFFLRVIWLFFKESELLANDETGCVNKWNCPKTLVTTVNRAATFAHIIAYTFIVTYFLRWARLSEGTVASSRSLLDKLFLVVDVWMVLLQIVVFVVSLSGVLSCKEVSNDLHDVYVVQVALVLYFLAAALLYSGCHVVMFLTSQLSRYRDWQVRTMDTQNDVLPIPRDQLARRSLLSPVNHTSSVLPANGTSVFAEDDLEAAQPGMSCRGKRPAGGTSVKSNTKTVDSKSLQDVLDDAQFENATVKLLKHARWYVVSILIVVFPLLVIQATMFIYRPVWGKMRGKAADVMFPWFFYAVPELVAGLWVLSVTTPHLRGALPCLGMCQRRKPLAELEDEDGQFEGARDMQYYDDVDAAEDRTDGMFRPLLHTDIQQLKEEARLGHQRSSRALQRAATTASVAGGPSSGSNRPVASPSSPARSGDPSYNPPSVQLTPLPETDGPDTDARSITSEQSFRI